MIKGGGKGREAWNSLKCLGSGEGLVGARPLGVCVGVQSVLREDLEDLVDPGGSCRFYLGTTWSHSWVSSKE